MRSAVRRHTKYGIAADARNRLPPRFFYGIIRTVKQRMVRYTIGLRSSVLPRRKSKET